MNEHFIKNIKIKNFKCFEDFKAEGFGRVNLIGGKNNVGKTAFMEACYINIYAEDIKMFIHALDNIKFMRENLNIMNDSALYNTKKFIELSNGINIKSNINSTIFSIEEKKGIKLYNFHFNNQNINVNSNDFSFDSTPNREVNFLDNFGFANWEIIDAYSSIQKKDEEEYLNSLLHTFDNTITGFKIINDKPLCKINDKYFELTELGDGVRHLVSIVTSLYSAENGYLFIDEVDNGIHYTMLDELWKVILDVSNRLDVQVFTTTHSKESIESFNRVQKEREDKNTYYFEMAKNAQTDEIFTTQIDSEQLEYELRNNESIRGE